jgi:hypothetical protein
MSGLSLKHLGIDDRRRRMTPHLAIDFEWRPTGPLTVEAGRLRFPSVEDVAGIYRFDLLKSGQQPTTYVGETDRFRRRFQHYRTPGPTQRTNIRLNKLMLDLIGAGGTASVSTCSAAVVESEHGPQQLDLRQKECRILLEHAALVLLRLEGHRVENL